MSCLNCLIPKVGKLALYYVILFLVFAPFLSVAHTSQESIKIQWLLAALLSLFLLLLPVLWTVLKMRNVLTPRKIRYETFLNELDAHDLSIIMQARVIKKKTVMPRSGNVFIKGILTIVLFLASQVAHGEDVSVETKLTSNPGIIITIVLILLPVMTAVIFVVVKLNKGIARFTLRQRQAEAEQLACYLLNSDSAEMDLVLQNRKSVAVHELKNNELSGSFAPVDTYGVIRKARPTANPSFVPIKKKAPRKRHVNRGFSNLIVWYLGTAVIWLVFGTTVGEYLGIKFLSPDIDQLSWLSFGRLRPVHTNAVFWGWSSLAMIGIGNYVVSVVSNRPIINLKIGWIVLGFINLAVVLGTICLMAGINNGGGEYREYTWPVMTLFVIGLLLTLYNFISTVARRTTREIYISNWYIISAVIFTVVISFIAYWPSWQSGLGETIVQGYWMHQGVGMWFMLFTLGIVYYFLPQQLNKSIYSYSLGVLAFWTQILFYTVIGTHHFVFSAIPWWLQTVAIVGSMGMVIPVIAGTTNFLMTFRNDWNKITGTYTLPFFIVGIIFYFTGSLQGTAEAFRYTNLLWHFTDFTVAHSHLTMYGIIAFFLWGAIYALVPRLTGREPSQLMVGTHFWLAFIGLLLYSIPLMIGSTLKGLLWMTEKPFLDGVVLMAPYWLWRAIGGTMMWVSHLVFACNFYTMASAESEPDVKMLAIEKIERANAASANITGN